MHDKMWREVPMFMSLWGTSIQEGHKKMKLDKIDIQQVLWAVQMFKYMYIQQRYKCERKKMLEWSHSYLDYANGILDRALKGEHDNDVYATVNGVPEIIGKYHRTYRDNEWVTK